MYFPSRTPSMIQNVIEERSKNQLHRGGNFLYFWKRYKILTLIWCHEARFKSHYMVKDLNHIFGGREKKKQARAPGKILCSPSLESNQNRGAASTQTSQSQNGQENWSQNLINNSMIYKQTKRKKKRTDGYYCHICQCDMCQNQFISLS